MRGIAFGQSHGSEHGRVPRKLSRVKDLLPKAFPLAALVAKSVSLVSFRGGPPAHVPREPARVKGTGPGYSPLGRFAPKASPSHRSVPVRLHTCHESSQGRRISGRKRPPWSPSWQKASPLACPTTASTSACHGTTQGRRISGKSVPLGRPHVLAAARSYIR